jgi:hypothetical protein
MVAGCALTAAMMWGCVTEEIPPPAIHTSAYVTSQSEETPEDNGSVVKTIPFDAATSNVPAKAVPAAAPTTR